MSKASQPEDTWRKKNIFILSSDAEDLKKNALPRVSKWSLAIRGSIPHRVFGINCNLRIFLAVRGRKNGCGAPFLAQPHYKVIHRPRAGAVMSRAYTLTYIYMLCMNGVACCLMFGFIRWIALKRGWGGELLVTFLWCNSKNFHHTEAARAVI